MQKGDDTAMDTEKLRILPRSPEPTYPGQVVRVPI